jgi:hypothetical protein
MQLNRTITSIFMVPTLKVPKDKLMNNGFKNAYIQDNERPDYKNCIFLLFKPKNLDKFREFLDDEYERTKAVIEDYDCENGYVVVVYELDEKYSSDFEFIKQGKYSKTSKDFQKLFPKVVKILTEDGLHRDEVSLQYRIFNKSNDLIEFWKEKLHIDIEQVLGEDLEVWEGFDLERETLNINKLKQS